MLNDNINDSNKSTSDIMDSTDHTFVHFGRHKFKYKLHKEMDLWVQKLRHTLQKYGPDLIKWLEGEVDGAVKGFIEYILRNTHI